MSSKCKTVFLNGCFMLLASLVYAQGEATGLRDIRGPLSLRSELWLLWLTLGLLALAGLIGGIIYYFRRSRKLPELPPRPAWEIALESLEALGRSTLVKEGRHTEYYFQISVIVRRYIEARFEIRAAEMTTEEFMDKAKSSPVISVAHKDFLREFLNFSDMVKFAKFVPSVNEADEALRLARRFVEETRPPVEANIKE